MHSFDPDALLWSWGNAFVLSSVYPWLTIPFMLGKKRLWVSGRRSGDRRKGKGRVDGEGTGGNSMRRNEKWKTDPLSHFHITPWNLIRIRGFKSTCRPYILTCFWFFLLLAVKCGDPGVVSNAARSASYFLFDDVVTYTCEAGYQPDGVSSNSFNPSFPLQNNQFQIECQEDAKWTAKGTCKGSQFLDLDNARSLSSLERKMVFKTWSKFAFDGYNPFYGQTL